MDAKLVLKKINESIKLSEDNYIIGFNQIETSDPHIHKYVYIQQVSGGFIVMITRSSGGWTQWSSKIFPTSQAAKNWFVKDIDDWGSNDKIVVNSYGKSSKVAI